MGLYSAARYSVGGGVFRVHLPLPRRWKQSRSLAVSSSTNFVVICANETDGSRGETTGSANHESIVGLARPWMLTEMARMTNAGLTEAFKIFVCRSLVQ